MYFKIWFIYICPLKSFLYSSIMIVIQFKPLLNNANKYFLIFFVEKHPTLENLFNSACKLSNWTPFYINIREKPNVYISNKITSDN